MDNNQEEELRKIEEKQKEEIARIEQQTKPVQNVNMAYAVPIVIGLFLLFVILIVWGQKQNVPSPYVKPPPQTTSPPISTPVVENKNTASDFTVEDLNGNKVSLSSFMGKVVFLNFWATWCPPCRSEMPSIEKLYIKMKGKDFVIMAVSMDKDKQTVKKFIEDNKYTFPIYHDSDGAASKLYGVTGIPTTLLIDKSGNIVLKDVGSKDWSSEENLSKIEETGGFKVEASGGNIFIFDEIKDH